MEELKARKISRGNAVGEVLRSEEPISFYGGVNVDTGVIIEKNHPLGGKNVKGKILVFPNGKGSTVGSYSLYRMKKNNVAPSALVSKEADAIVAVGAIISEIPMVDKVEGYEKICDGMKIKVNATEGKIII